MVLLVVCWEEIMFSSYTNSNNLADFFKIRLIHIASYVQRNQPTNFFQLDIMIRPRPISHLAKMWIAIYFYSINGQF